MEPYVDRGKPSLVDDVLGHARVVVVEPAGNVHRNQEDEPAHDDASDARNAIAQRRNGKHQRAGERQRQQ